MGEDGLLVFLPANSGRIEIKNVLKKPGSKKESIPDRNDDTLIPPGDHFSLIPNQYTAGFGSTINDPNLLNVIRSFGGFYLGFAAYLIIALKKENLMDGAVISVVLAMVGFLTGRNVNLIMDGIPHPKIWVSLVIERFSLHEVSSS